MSNDTDTTESRQAVEAALQPIDHKARWKRVYSCVRAHRREYGDVAPSDYKSPYRLAANVLREREAAGS
jgi:hypothetical protein